MTGRVSTAFRYRTQERFSETIPLEFIKIVYPGVAEPACVVNDRTHYMLNGEKYHGIPFSLELISDDDSGQARGRITLLSAIDRRIFRAVKQMVESPQVTISVYSSEDFTDYVDGPADARLPIGTPVPEIHRSHLRLTNVNGNVISINGDLGDIDISTEPWPYVRVTPQRFPGTEE